MSEGLNQEEVVQQFGSIVEKQLAGIPITMDEITSVIPSDLMRFFSKLELESLTQMLIDELTQFGIAIDGKVKRPEGEYSTQLLIFLIQSLESQVLLYDESNIYYPKFVIYRSFFEASLKALYLIQNLGTEVSTRIVGSIIAEHMGSHQKNSQYWDRLGFLNPVPNKAKKINATFPDTQDLITKRVDYDQTPCLRASQKNVLNKNQKIDETEAVKEYLLKNYSDVSNIAHARPLSLTSSTDAFSEEKRMYLLSILYMPTRQLILDIIHNLKLAASRFEVKQNLNP